MAQFPHVEVEVRDYSAPLPEADGGRTCFAVFVSDRGRHNQVVEWRSVPQFIRNFGRPNVEKYGQMHNIIANFTQFNSRNFGIRASLIDSEVEKNNAAIANAAIKYNNPDGSEELMFGKYIFTNLNDSQSNFSTDSISQYVFTDRIGFEQFRLNTYIRSNADDNTYAKKVIARDTLIEDSVYYLRLENTYNGTTSVNEDDNNALLVQFADILGDNDKENVLNYQININNDYVETEAYKYFKGVEIIAGGLYQFTVDNNIIKCENETSFNAVNEEDWIYPSRLNSSFARQIIKKQINDVTSEYELVLDSIYNGTSSQTPESVKSYVPLEIISDINIRTNKSIDIQDTDNLFHIAAVGTGSYYNNIYLKGVRNLELENYWMDDPETTFPEPLYKYAFMDIGIYERKGDGSSVLLEGPFKVSLINTIYNSQDGNNGELVLDPISGNSLFLPNVIKRNSDIIEIFETPATGMLEGINEEAEKLRLQVLSLFSEGVIVDSEVRGKEGFFLENGEDGILFDSRNRMRKNNTEIIGSIRRCYEGTMPSADENNSIKKIVQEIYPRYTFDYVISGGYHYTIQKAAADLAWKRQSMICLADLGHNMNTQEELNARRNEMPYNHWTIALYSQYRKILDAYTGKPILVSPIYDAIERHLIVDRDYGLGEPVMMGIKGSINSSIELVYEPDNLEMEELIKAQINPTINDMSRDGGKYFLQEITGYKKNSVLQRQYIVKFICFLKKELPPRLKPFLGFKSNDYIINQSRKSISSLLSDYSIGDNKLLEGYEVILNFDRDSYTLFSFLELSFVRVIEKISVVIRV